MRRLLIWSLLWLFCLGSLPGCGSEDTGKGTNAAPKRLRVPKGDTK